MGQPNLTLAADYIEHQSGRLVSLRWPVSAIADIRFEKSPIDYNAYGSNVGERYTVSFRHLDGAVIDVKFWNLFHVNHDYPGIYANMIDDVRKFVIKNLINEQLKRFRTGEEIEIGRLLISAEGIGVSKTGLAFNWNDLKIESYERYFVLIKPSAQQFKYKMYFGEWHSEITYQIVRKILDFLPSTT